MGSVVVNDLIVPTVDPRLPFGGRRLSGFGATRGTEGLLALTTAKSISVRGGRFRPHYDPPDADQLRLALAYIAAVHGHSGIGGRLARWAELARALWRSPRRVKASGSG